jgi:hypothetical protein
MSKDEEIFISSQPDKKSALSNLNISVKLNDKSVEKYGKELVNNILSIKLEPEHQSLPKTQNYSICMQTSKKN